jgi:hypothetical protein
MGEGAAEALFPVAGGNRIGRRVAEAEAHPYAPLGGSGEQAPDPGLRLGEEGAGHDQDGEVLAGAAHGRWERPDCAASLGP